MRKTLLIVAMLLLVAPVMAATTVKVNVNPAEQFLYDGNRVQPVTVLYVADANIRAYALDINIDNVGGSPNFQLIRNFKVGESNGAITGGSSGYGIFPSRFREFVSVAPPNWNVDVNYNPTVAWNEPGSTGTGMGYPKMIVEMGTLYAGEPNRPAWSGTLFKFDVNAWGKSGTFHITVAANTLRGGVVNGDGNTITATYEGNDVVFAAMCTTPTPEVGNARAVAEAAWTAQGFTLCGSGVVNCAQVGNIVSQESDCYTMPHCIVYTYGIQATVPNVVNQAEATATNNITAAGLCLGTRTTAHSNTIAAGNIVSTNPPATTVTCACVDYVVSLGPCVVPNVVCNAEATATASIVAQGFTCSKSGNAWSNTCAVGTVASTTPAAGATPGCGTNVTYTISLGPCVVPNVVGMLRVDANSAIINAGFVVGVMDFNWSASVPKGKVMAQSPASGGSPGCGTAINYTTSQGPTPVACFDPCGTTFSSQKTSYNSYITNKWDPNCWCEYPTGSGFQCHGDADGKATAAPDNYRIFSADLTLVTTNWKKKVGVFPAGANPCADIDHKATAAPDSYRVFSNDLARISGATTGNWKRKGCPITGATLPRNCPLSDTKNNTYVKPAACNEGK